MAQERTRTLFVCRGCQQVMELDPGLLRLDRALLRAGERSLERLLAPTPLPAGAPAHTITTTTTTTTTETNETTTTTTSSGEEESDKRDTATVTATTTTPITRTVTASGRIRAGLSPADTLAQLLGTSGAPALPLLNVSEAAVRDPPSPARPATLRTSARRTRHVTRPPRHHSTVFLLHLLFCSSSSAASKQHQQQQHRDRGREPGAPADAELVAVGAVAAGAVRGPPDAAVRAAHAQPQQRGGEQREPREQQPQQPRQQRGQQRRGPRQRRQRGRGAREGGVRGGV